MAKLAMLGEAHRAKGNWSKALDAFNKALKADPNNLYLKKMVEFSNVVTG